LHVVTNARFAAGFEARAGARQGRLRPVVHDDGTTTNETRLGAIGDIRFAVEAGGLDGEDLLVVAGDNLFDFSLAEYVDFWRARRAGGDPNAGDAARPGTAATEDASCIAVFECPDPALVSQYSVVTLDAGDRVRGFVEKPAAPQSNLVGIATYLYAAAHAALIPTYLQQGNSPDAPGNLVAWLYPRVPVYGYRFRGRWVDIGDKQQLLEADNELRERRGLPPRAEYTPE
jgi:glucose-1-phosphate thymidylyltransferase